MEEWTGFQQCWRPIIVGLAAAGAFIFAAVALIIIIDVYEKHQKKINDIAKAALAFLFAAILLWFIGNGLLEDGVTFWK